MVQTILISGGHIKAKKKEGKRIGIAIISTVSE